MKIFKGKLRKHKFATLMSLVGGFSAFAVWSPFALFGELSFKDGLIAGVIVFSSCFIIFNILALFNFYIVDKED